MTCQIVVLFIKDASLRVKNIELALGAADSDLSAPAVHVLQGTAADVAHIAHIAQIARIARVSVLSACI